MSYVEITPSDLLPCPEAATWTDAEWRAFNRARDIRLGKAVPKPLVQVPRHPVPQQVPTFIPSERGRRIYLRRIGPQMVVKAEPLVEIPAGETDVTAFYREAYSTYAKPSRVILDEVCRAFNVSVNDVLSERRTMRVVRARQEACFRMRHETRLSFPQIGRVIGGKDHTTPMHAVTRINKRLASGERLLSAPNVVGVGADGYIYETS